MNPKDTYFAFQQVRELLSDEKRWIKHAFARTDEGIRVPPNDVDASCFCLVGACERIFKDEDTLTAIILLHLEPAIIKVTNRQEYSATTFNDRASTKHSDILAVLDEAIKQVSKEI